MKEYIVRVLAFFLSTIRRTPHTTLALAFSLLCTFTFLTTLAAVVVSLSFSLTLSFVIARWNA